MKSIDKREEYSAPVAPAESVLPNLKKPKRLKPTELDESMYLHPVEVKAFFAAIRSRRDRAIFRIVYNHGLRAHEVGLLRLTDYREGILFIRRGKGGVSGPHELFREEVKTLETYLKVDRGSKPGLLFPSRQGRRGITRFQLDKLMKRYCAMAGIPREKAHMHVWKRSCRMNLAQSGFGPHALQDWLGERDPAASRIYTRLWMRRREESFQKNDDWV